MIRPDFDIVIVGARCAGASLGVLLAQAGVRVLIVERDPLHTDQVLSTHTIHPPGMDVLDHLGVGAAIREVTPPTRRVRLAKNEIWAETEFDEGRAGYCPRRFRLDSLLQDAAAEAGAELWDQSRVSELIWHEGRAVGVRLTRGGEVVDIGCELVVGADGRRSTVARETNAKEYMAYDAPRAMYWGYWDVTPEWWSDQYPFDMYLAHRGDDYRVIFQTDEDQLLIGSLPPSPRARQWRSDPLPHLRENLMRDPVVAPLVSQAEPLDPIRGTLKERYFFRQGAGPGWVLVGDAGHHKDFVIGDGITEALLQAESLAKAILQKEERALLRWWRARDVRALSGYFWGQDEGAAGAPRTIQEVIIDNLSKDPKAARLMNRLPEHRATPYEVLPPYKVLPWLLKAAMRGKLAVIPDFVAFVRRAREFKLQLRERERLLTNAGSG